MEKRVTFSASDNGLSSVFDKMKAKSRELSQTLIQDALKYSSSTKEQIKYLEEQIKLTEKRNQLNAAGARLTVEQRFEKQLSGGMNREDAGSIRRAEVERTDSLRTIDKELRAEDTQVKLLREVIDTIKLTAKDEIKESKKTVEDSLKKRPTAPLTPEEELKRGVQKELLTKEEKPENIFKSVLVANVLSNMISRLSQVGSTFSGARNEEQVIGSLLGNLQALPFGLGAAAGTFGTAYSRSSEEQLKTQIASNKIKGVTGQGAMFGADQFGYSIGETQPVAEAFARAQGSGKGLKGGTLDAIALMKAFGLDQSQVMNQVTSGRYSEGGSGAMRDISMIIDTMKGKGVFKDGDMTLLPEILQKQNSLVSNQGKVLEKIDQRATAQVIAAFTQVGGSFGNDPRATERIMKVDEALRSPSNDYQKAMNFAVLAKANPGASYLQLLKEQDKGLSGKGFLSGTLKSIEQQFGGGEAGVLALMQRTGLSAGQSETLFKGFQKDRTMFDNITSQKHLDEALSRAGVNKRGIEATAPLEQSQAAITDAFVKGSIAGLEEVAKRFGGKIAEYANKAIAFMDSKENATSNH